MHYIDVVDQFPVLALAATWLVVAVSLAGWGIAVGPLLLRWSGYVAMFGFGFMWVGLLVFTLVALTLDLLLPLGARVSTWLLVLVLTSGLVFGTVRVLRLHRESVRTRLRSGWWIALALAVVLLVYAGWALGEPGNYDTGLYHIGAINYSRDFPLVLGLANLHERFGFNSSMWPLSAWLGSIGWRGEEFRLVNGLLLMMMLLDTLVRVRRSRRGSVTPGTGIMIVGSVLVLGVLAQYPARLLASSAQDTAALILGIVAIAYLSDGLARRPWWKYSLNTTAMVVATAASISSALMRPLGWFFFAGLIAVALGSSLAGRAFRKSLRILGPVLVVGAVAGVVMGIRDARLSGWLFYPAGVVGFRVDWRFPDPSVSSDRITAWARTPFQDVETTLASSDWVVGWLGRLPTDWALPAVALLVGVASALWWGARRVGESVDGRGMVLALVPVAMLLVAWLATAPDPRFAWAGIVALGLVPLGFVAQRLPVSRILLGSGLFLGALVILASLRGSWQEWSWAATPPPRPALAEAALADGTSIVVPTATDQCWAAYPLCRPDYEDPAVETRGDGVADGFRPATNAP